VQRWFEKMASEFAKTRRKDGRPDPRRCFYADGITIGTTGNGKKVLSRTNQTVFRRKDKEMPHYPLLQCISAAGTMMAPMLVMPGLKSAEIE
jgi:hypothetical protein